MNIYMFFMCFPKVCQLFLLPSHARSSLAMSTYIPQSKPLDWAIDLGIIAIAAVITCLGFILVDLCLENCLNNVFLFP